MQGESVNKKCIESLIKAGAFDEFEQTRSTLMASFEDILDSIADTNKKSFKGQVTMFDLAFGGADNIEKTENDNSNNNVENQLEKMKYKYTTLKEYTEKELLSMEKEMLGLYISGHPLEQFREQIAEQTNINTLKMKKLQETEDKIMEDVPKYRDGQVVRIAGIINSVKKKYTKNNKIMAFVTIEDLFGQCEIIVFENCYQMCSDILMDESIVLVEGRLSIREDEDVKIVANKILPFKENSEKGVNSEKNINKGIKSIEINITNLNEEQKEKLRGAIRFFSGDRNNCRIDIKNGNKVDYAGGVLMNSEILNEFSDIVGEQNVTIHGV